MTKFKGRLLLVLILVFVLSMTLLTSTTVAFGATGDVAELTVGETTTQYTNFEDALSAFNTNGGTLKLLDDLNADNFFTSSNKEIEFTKKYNQSMTFDLNGHVIDKQAETAGYSSVISIDEYVTITITDSSSTGGGTITGGNNRTMSGGISNSGTLTLSSVTVSGNKGSQGGGIYNSPGCKLTLTNVVVTENEATTQGGGVYNAGTMTITDSSITNNEGVGELIDDPFMGSYRSGSEGGGVYSSQSFTVCGNVVITGNTAYDEDAYETVTNNWQRNNTVKFDDANPFTGEIGVYSSYDDTFTSNWNSNHTGLFTSDKINTYVVKNTSGQLMVSSDTTYQATVDYAAYTEFGRALSQVNLYGGTLKLLDASAACDYLNYFSEGSIPFEGTNPITFDLNGLTIDLSPSDYRGAIFATVESGANVTITNGTITGCNSATNGGAIYNEGALTLDNLTIENNEAGYGSAVYNDGTALTITDCTIQNNSDSGTSGGSLLSWTDVTIGGNTTIANNTINGTTSNCFLSSGNKLIFDETNQFTGNVGVTMSNPGEPATWDAVHTGTITSDDSNYVVKVNGANLSLAEPVVLAEVTVDETTTQYFDFAEALAAVNSTGGTLHCLLM